MKGWDTVKYYRRRKSGLGSAIGSALAEYDSLSAALEDKATCLTSEVYSGLLTLEGTIEVSMVPTRTLSPCGDGKSKSRNIVASDCDEDEGP